MDKLISKIAALGVPGLVLVCAISASGLAGGAAIVAALSALGPGGMLGGIATLGVIGLVTHGLAEFGTAAVLRGVVQELVRRGMTEEEILKKVAHYPVSRSLKAQLRDQIHTAFTATQDAVEH